MKLFAFFILLINFSFNMYSQTNSDVPSVTMEEFFKLLKTNSEIVVLDVRTPAELEGNLGRIDKAINIPIQELPNRINELKPYKEKQIYVICRTQNRSYASAQFLNKNGFNSVYVIGGMTEYYNKSRSE